MNLPTVYRSGRRPALAAPLTGDLPTDTAIAHVLRQVNLLYADVGIYLTPTDSIEAAVNTVVAGETIVLLPGEYYLNSSITIGKRCTLIGIGRVRIRLNDAFVNVTGTDVWFKGIEFVRDVRNAAEGALHFASTALRSRVDECLFDTPSAYGVYVGSAYTAICDCKFLNNVAHTLGDADIYYADGVLNGIVAGNSWSTTRTYVLSYQIATNMSEAANGVAGQLQVRP